MKAKRKRSHYKFTWRNRLYAFIKRIVITILVVVIGLPIILAVIFKYVNPPIWGWEIHREIFPIAGYPQQTHHQWVPLSAISASLPLAVMASEDQRFMHHWGIDFHALWQVVEEGGMEGPSRGASTITQQTAKNLFLFPSHSYIRKAYEAYIALLLELIWGKERIMEMYLNIVEFGPGVYGVQAAAQHYFSIDASHVTRLQAARLAVVLPNPYQIHPTPMTSYVRRRSHWILKQMRNLGVIVWHN